MKEGERVRERIFSYDALKVIAIYMVCFYHFGRLDSGPHIGYFTINYLLWILSSMCVPIFFMVNGALLLNKPYNHAKHVRKTMKIIILLVLWRFISVLFITRFNFQHHTLLDYINLFFSSKFPDVPLSHFWFFESLICIYIFFPLIKLAYDHNSSIFRFAFIALVLFSFVANAIDELLAILSWNVKLGSIYFDDIQAFNPFGTTYAICYFVMGGVLGNVLAQKRDRFKTLWLLPTFVICWVLLGLWGANANKHGMQFDVIFGGYPTIMTAGMTASLFCIAYKVKFASNVCTRTMSKISENTLGIYLIHWIIGALFINDFYNMFPATVRAWLWIDVLHALFLLITAFVVAIIIKRIPYLRRTLEL